MTMNTVGSLLLWFYSSELGLDASPVMKNPPKLEGDATDGIALCHWAPAATSLAAIDTEKSS